MDTAETPNASGRSRRILVISTVEEVGHSLHPHVHEDDVVKIVIPVVGEGIFDWLANNERAFSRAGEVADRVADEVPGRTVETSAGESDVELAIRDALATFPADEIVVAVSRAYEQIDDVIVLGADAPSGARRIAGVPVRFVTVADG